MALPFLDRQDEQRRLRRAMRAPGGELAVVYGRRRCGKSTLLQHAIAADDIYYLADQREVRLQLPDVAAGADRVVPRFSAAGYATWDALLQTLDDRLDRTVALCLDEFPYLVQQAPALPSLLQKYLDRAGPKRLNLVLCGSSQRMMHGLVLDRTAPLFGRAREVLRIEPLRAGWIQDALGVDGVGAVEAWSVWGGVPRYWELASVFDTLGEAIEDLVLHRNGVLHDEPMGLLLDEMRSAVQPYSLLSVIGQGCHRMSEIAGRLGKPATSLVRPLGQLVDLGYVRREVPFGESERSSRRTLYKVADPFLAFHFRFVQPNKSKLQLGGTAHVADRIALQLPSHVSGAWEDLARASVPLSGIADLGWGPARRWWGAGLDGTPMEIDVAAESVDRTAVLVGECKWSEPGIDPAGERDRLIAKAKQAPWAEGRHIVPVLWLKHAVRADGMHVRTPEDVLGVLR
jgi:AAA+ ATPase superfamily predicted ATPase